LVARAALGLWRQVGNAANPGRLHFGLFHPKRQPHWQLQRDFRRFERSLERLLFQARQRLGTAALLLGFARLLAAVGTESSQQARPTAAGLIAAGARAFLRFGRRARLRFLFSRLDQFLQRLGIDLQLTHLEPMLDMECDFGLDCLTDIAFDLPPQCLLVGRAKLRL
jgi:hypothetical protein